MYTKITFEDHGQDFLEWLIDDEGNVLDCQPFQAWVWCKRKVLNCKDLKIGAMVQLTMKADDDGGVMTIIYPIEVIEQVENKRFIPRVPGDEIYH